MPWGAIASVAGGLLAGSAAEDAAGMQAAATKESVAEQRRQYDQNRADLAPFRETGSSAIYKLSSLLGLGPRTSGGGAFRTRDQIRAELMANKPMTGLVRADTGGAIDEQYARENGLTYNANVFDPRTGQLGSWGNFNNSGEPSWSPAMQTVKLGAPADYNVDSEVERIYGAQGDAVEDADYGSLLRKFSVQDFYDDPVTKLGLQFGLDQGNKSIQRLANARGVGRSGSTLKDLTKYVTDYIGTKAGDSYNRYVGDQTNIYNRLAGVAGTGQTAANQTAAYGTNMANNVSNLTSSLGNARGAASIAQGNAYSGAANSIGNWYNQNKMISQMGSGYDNAMDLWASA